MRRVFFPVFCSVALVIAGLMMVPTAVRAQSEKFNQAVLKWHPVSGASSYTIYYKEHGQSKFTHSIAGIPSEASSYTINYLKKWRGYWYAITAVDANGKEYLTTGLKRIRSVPMP